MPNDGGKIALSGYLYQTIGLLGIAAHLSSFESPQSNDLDLLIRFIDINKRLGIAPEVYEDAILSNLSLQRDDRNVLIQFKYSNTLILRKKSAILFVSAKTGDFYSELFA